MADSFLPSRLILVEIVIASTITPFVKGGDVLIVDSLEEALTARGHSVFTLRIPFDPDYRFMTDQMLALRLLDIRNYGECLIAIRPPSYLLRHPNKLLWFIHHHRTAYDLWNEPYREFPENQEGYAYRDLIYSADMAALREARKIFTLSSVVSRRLRHFNGIDSEVLYSPLMKPEQYAPRSFGDYIVYISRLVPHKRQHLAIDSMRYVTSDVKLILAGAADGSKYRDELLNFIAKHSLQGKVALLDGWISEDRKIELLSDCVASVYFPLDEDSYGYVSLETYASEKPVITTADAGGVLELVEDGINGLVADPYPESIAKAIDTLFYNKELARRMGLAGKARIYDLGINWDHVIDTFLL